MEQGGVRAVKLVVDEVSKAYPGLPVLDGIAFDVAPGEFVSVIGPSGCGKTTLLRCFNRVNERYGNVRTEGEVCILGKNIYEPDVSLAELRKRVGMVFQRPNPLPISIYENVLFGLHVHTERGTFNRAEREIRRDS